MWQYGDLGKDTRGVVSCEHVKENLHDRIFEIPVMALYFHLAMGWGVATAFQIVGKYEKSVVKHLTIIFLGPAMAMLWDIPHRLLSYFLGASQLASTSVIVIGGVLISILTGPRLRTSSELPKDALLLFSPAISTGYFLYNALFGRGATVIPPDLKAHMIVVAAVIMSTFMRSCGFLEAKEDDRKNKVKCK